MGIFNDIEIPRLYSLLDAQPNPLYADRPVTQQWLPSMFLDVLLWASTSHCDDAVHSWVGVPLIEIF